MGQVIDGKFRVISNIGRGGFGLVYLAQQDSLDRRVAVKFLRPGASEELHERFYREAKVLACTDHHPNLINGYAQGVFNGTPYIVCEYIEGRSLEYVIAELGALPLVEAMRISAQVCLGLEHLHAQNILHRDIKPANIMLLADGSVKVIDFGLAQHSDQKLTATGNFVGTPFYASPELISGSDVGTASDIYSVGCVFFELLTGKRLVGSSAGLPEAMKQHIVGVDSIIRKQLADTPQPLVDLILRMTAREPGARVQSAADAASELTALAAEVVPGKMPQKASIAKACLPLLALGLPCILVGSWFLLSSLAAENLCVLTAPLPKGQKAVVQRWLVQIEKDLGREAVAQQLADMGVDKEEEIDKLISVAHAITGDRCDLSSMGKFCDRFGDLSAGLTAAQAKPLIAAVRRLDQRFGEAPNWSFDFHWKLAQSLRESGLRQESLDVMAMSAAANGGRVVDSSLAEFLALLQQLKGQEQVAFYEHDFSRSKEIQRLKSYLSTVGSGESFPYTDSRAIDWILTLTPAEQSKVIYELCCCIAEVQSGSRNNTPAQFSLLQAYANRVRVHTARLDMCVQFIKALELYQAAKFLPALQGFKGILRLDMQMQRLRYPIASYMLPCALHVEPPAARLSELTDLLNRVQADFPESDLVGSIRKAIDGERAKQAAPRPTS